MFAAIREPDERMRAVTAFASKVPIDESISAKKQVQMYWNGSFDS